MVGSKKVILSINLKSHLIVASGFFKERLKAIMTLVQPLWLQVVVRPESQLRQW